MVVALRTRWLGAAAALLLAGCATTEPGSGSGSGSGAPEPVSRSTPIPVRVVLVSTFEIGADSGDRPGEFQNWVEKLPLPQTLAFPSGYHALRYNPDLQVLGVVSGEGPARMASSITALGHDPRFDLSHAYFLLAGIGGIDPNFGSVGSAVWAPHVVDGSNAHEIDAREIPRDWPDGFTPLQGARPDTRPRPAASSMWGDAAFTLDPGLVDWAYRLSRSVALADTPAMQAVRARYRSTPAAQQPPAVMKGDTLASPVFWVGKRMNRWAERWVGYWTDGTGTFATTAEEDAGFMEALTFLGRAGIVDPKRVLVLRSASNFDMPPPGETAAALLAGELTEAGFSGFVASVNAAYDAGSPVVRELATHWDRYRDHIPGH